MFVLKRLMGEKVEREVIRDDEMEVVMVIGGMNDLEEWERGRRVGGIVKIKRRGDDEVWFGYVSCEGGE